jgi:hypothetical protein
MCLVEEMKQQYYSMAIFFKTHRVFFRGMGDIVVKGKES